MFVKIGRLINLYFIIIIVIHKSAKKHDINIAFHNFKVKCTQNKTELHSKIANFNYKVQNCKFIKMQYLMY